VRKKINIAIDGYSSCGKSTLAKALAKELNYLYIDSGAMYRAITLFALKNQGFKNDEVMVDKMQSIIDNAYVTFKYNTDSKQVDTFLNGVNVEKEIRSMQVSKYVSKIAALFEVRKKLVRLQQRMSETKGVVMDGRDIGTVVLPNAELKFFMTAEPDVRAQRRFDELRSTGVEVTLEEVTANVKERDYIDSNREHDPLRQAEQAVVVDNSNLTLDEQFTFIMGQVSKALESAALTS